MRTLFLLVVLSGACVAPREPARHTPSTDALVGLALEDLDDRVHDLEAAARSGPVALVFWQPWCKACLEEAPGIARAARAHPNITFFGVVSGADDWVDEDAVRARAEELELPYPQLRDRELTLTQGLGVEATPTVVVVTGGDRIVHHASEPPADWSRWDG